MDTVMTYFETEFKGCTLTQLCYPGDASADLFTEWAEECEADEAIVLYSSFDTDASGGDGSLEPNTTYDDFQWILVRDNCDVTRSVSKMTEIERRGGKRWDKPKKAEKSRDCGGGKF